MELNDISLDFIAGLIVGEGTFCWTKSPRGKIPTFALKLHARDTDLVVAVRDKLGLKERVYVYKHSGRHFAYLIVRNIGSLKNNIIPLLYPRLTAYKLEQFRIWFDGFYEPDIAEAYEFFPNAFRRRFPELCRRDKEFDDHSATIEITEEPAISS